MNEAERKSNLLGLIILFMVFTPIGVVLSYFYIMFQVNAHIIWLNIISNFVFGLVLAALVWLIKRLLRITNDVMSLVVVILSLAVIIYVMWSMWFALMTEMLYRGNRDFDTFADIGRMVYITRYHLSDRSNFMVDLRYFNNRGTWSLNSTQWNGMTLSAVWAAEFLVMVSFPLMVAYASAGLYLHELRAWVKEKFMNYGFSAFDDEELDRLASGDIDVVLQKPLEAQGGPMNAIAVCYHRGDPTEFIAVYKSTWDRDGNLTKGRHVMTVKLGLENIDALDTGLQRIHYPSVVESLESEDEFDITADEDIFKEVDSTGKESAQNTDEPMSPEAKDE